MLCAHPTHVQTRATLKGMTTEEGTKRLYRSRKERMVSGVCGGIAEYFGLDPTLVRVGWVILSVFTVGTGFIGYIVMAVIVPEAPESPDSA